MMKVIVIGLGKVGELLTSTLALENHDVIAVDLSEQKVNDVVNQYDVNGYVGNGATTDALYQVDAKHADMLISVTNEDELNILAGLTAKKLGTKYVISRVRKPEYLKQSLFWRDQFGFSMIANPELEAANEIVRLILFSSANRVETFAKGKVELLGLRVSDASRIQNVRLNQLSKYTKSKFLICAVRHEGKVIIPNGDYCICKGDEIFLTGSHRDLSAFCYDTGFIQKKIQYVMVIGGSLIALYLAKMLAIQGIKVKIIERDTKKCEFLAEALPYASIIEADGSNDAILLEEGLEHTDAFISLTGIDEENIILSLLAKQFGVKKAIAKVNRSSLMNAAEKMDIDSIISPKQIIANQISAYIRSKSNNDEMGSVQTLYQLVDNEVEALEFIISPTAKYIGKILNEMPIIEGILIAAILRQNEVIVPNGTTTIEEKDHVIIVAKNKHIIHFNDIFKK